MRRRSRPGASLREAIDLLESDPARVIEGVDAFQRWNQDLIDTTIASLDGVHFDIAEPIRRCEAMIAPPGGAAAMYYTGPSEDFSRPGRTWYPTLGKTRFPLWREVSICYHEGVPGHHLQIAQVRYLSDRLTRFQRLAGFTSGHGEGWALYAERLMGELGYLDDPAFELGMLSAQAMRAVRVIVDIGMHLELPIPDRRALPPGRALDTRAGVAVRHRAVLLPGGLHGLGGRPLPRAAGPGHLLQGRRAGVARVPARRRQDRKGAAFDLKDFHRFALDLGRHGARPAAGRARALLNLGGRRGPEARQKIDHQGADLLAGGVGVVGLGHIQAGLAERAGEHESQGPEREGPDDPGVHRLAEGAPNGHGA